MHCLVPAEAGVGGVELGAEWVGDVDREAAAALEGEVEEGGGLRVVGDGGGERGVQRYEHRIDLGRRGGPAGVHELRGEIAQIVIKTQRA